MPRGTRIAKWPSREMRKRTDILETRETRPTTLRAFSGFFFFFLLLLFLFTFPVVKKFRICSRKLPCLPVSHLSPPQRDPFSPPRMCTTASTSVNASEKSGARLGLIRITHERSGNPNSTTSTRPRRGAPKSKSGCANCKRRKVKVSAARVRAGGF